MAMPLSTPKAFLYGYVNTAQGLVSREIFVGEDIYQLEQERVFARVWLFVGHESQIPKPGDYFVGKMGEESVIMARDRAGEIHVFLNSCRHRGMKVCRYDEGNTPVFTCPYHGWSYGLDGSLVGVPYFKEAYHSELKKEEWGLVEVAQMINYKSTIWATWDKTAPSFHEYIGDMLFYLDELLDGRDGTPGGSEIISTPQKWITPANWKFGAENVAGDGYHNISHRSVDLVGIGPSAGRGRRDSAGPNEGLRHNITVGFGHSAKATPTEVDLPWSPSFLSNKIVAEWAEHCYYERQKNYGVRSRVQGGGGNVFPNMGYWSNQPRRMALWGPGGSARRSEYWSWGLVDKSAPQEMKDLMRHYAMRYSGPGGMTEQDDMENWNYATLASSGTIAKRNPYNYSLGLGREITRPDMPGTMTIGITESNQLGMYKFWAELMDAESWDDLLERRERAAHGRGKKGK